MRPHRDAAQHDGHLAVGRMIVRIISMQRLLRAAGLDAEANDARDLRRAHDLEPLLALPVRVPALEDAAGDGLEERCDDELGAGVRVREDAEGALGGLGEEAGAVGLVPVEGGLEVGAKLLAEGLWDEVANEDGAVAVKEGLEEGGVGGWV